MTMKVPKKLHRKEWDEAKRRLTHSGYSSADPYEAGQSIHHPYHPNNPSNPYAREPGKARIESPQLKPNRGDDGVTEG